MEEFRTKLFVISQELTTREVNELKFLFSDNIPQGRAESITTALELFQVLERRDILRKDKLGSLADCLERIGRIDLKVKLLESPRAVKVSSDVDKGSEHIAEGSELDSAGEEEVMRKAESSDESADESSSFANNKNQRFRFANILTKRELPQKSKSKNTKSYNTKKGVGNKVDLDGSLTVAEEKEIPKFKILHGEVTKDFTGEIKFQAHLAEITSLEQAEEVLEQLKKDPEIAEATHNVWACRIYDDKQKMYIEESDDKEKSKGVILLNLLKGRNTENVVVIVTVDYWYGKKVPKSFSRLSNRHIKMCADNLLQQRSSTNKDDTVPAEILARGPEALKAYEEALESGKTKNQRLLVMAVGPARAGKTSLLKSFNGELFDPKEDSTVGIQQTVCKSKQNCWSKDSDESISYTDCMADVICQNLRKENNKTDAEDSKEAIKEQSPTVPKNDDVDGGAVGDNTTPSEPQLSPNDQTTKKIEDREYGIEKRLPKPIEEKVFDKLKDAENEKTKENELYIKTVDLAGQAVYNVIHPIFLTLRAVFILVYNLKNALHEPMKSKVEKGGSERELVDPFEMTNLENLELWLSCISSYTDAQRKTKVDGLSLPPVFIAGTHADAFESDLESAKQIIRDIYKSLSPNKNPSGCHLKRDQIYTVDNKKSGNGEIRDESVRKLKADIEKLSKSLPHMNEDIPINWLLFEEELSKLVEKEKKYITIDEARKMASECKVNTSTESNEFATLLNYLHDLKSIIYFEETKLVFIDTQWLVEVFTKVIEVTPAEKRGGLDDSWDKLEEEGVLERPLVEHVWKGLVDEQNTVDSLLFIMEKFSLICRWSTTDGEDVYLVPAMLCNSKEREDIAKFLSHQTTSTMVVRFSASHISLGIFPRLFVAIVEEGKKRWPKLRQPKLHKNFCRIFGIGEGRKLDICVIQSSPRTISVTVCNKQNIDGQRVTEFCKHFREMLHGIFHDMRHSFPWMQNMTLEYGILCPVCTSSSTRCKRHKDQGCTRDSCLHFVNGEELLDDLPVCDQDVAGLDNVIDEEAYSYWFPRRARLPEGEEEEDKGNKSSEVPVLAVYGPLPPLVDVQELQTICPSKAAERVANILQLDRTSLKDPPAEVVKKCRSFCIHFLKPHKRHDIIKELRNKLPSGMTGPLGDESDQYENLDFQTRKFLTQSLCGDDVWKCMASEFKISNTRLPYFAQQKNPAEAVLEDVCRARSLTLGEVYDIIVKSGAAAIADEYL